MALQVCIVSLEQREMPHHQKQLFPTVIDSWAVLATPWAKLGDNVCGELCCEAAPVQGAT